MQYASVGSLVESVLVSLLWIGWMTLVSLSLSIALALAHFLYSMDAMLLLTVARLCRRII